MKAAPRGDELHFSDLPYIYISYMQTLPHIHVLQLIETLPSVTNWP